MNILRFLPGVIPNLGVQAVFFPEIFRQIFTHGHGLLDFDSIQIATSLTNATAGTNFLIDLNFSFFIERNSVHGATIGSINTLFTSDTFGLVSDSGPAGRMEDLGAIFRRGISGQFQSNAAAGAANLFNEFSIPD